MPEALRSIVEIKTNHSDQLDLMARFMQVMDATRADIKRRGYDMEYNIRLLPWDLYYGGMWEAIIAGFKSQRVIGTMIHSLKRSTTELGPNSSYERLARGAGRACREATSP